MKLTPFYQLAALSLFLVFVISSCKQELAPLPNPGIYVSPAFEITTETERKFRSQMDDMTNIMKAGRFIQDTLTEEILLIYYEIEAPSLADITSSYYDGRIRMWLPKLAAATGNAFDVDNAPSGDGGVLGSYLFDENGLELEQMVDKGMFAATFYNYAVGLLQEEVTLETVDKLIALWGAHPDFPNSDDPILHGNPDVLMAKYAARRDQNDGNGLYTRMRDQFIRLKAAIDAGEEYDTEKEEAIDEIMMLWEMGCMATVINYCQSAIVKLSETNLTAEKQGAGLHDYSEAVGFLHGWLSVESTYRMMRDVKIESLLVLMNAPVGQIPTSHLLLSDPFTELPKLQEVIDEIQDVYGFTEEEVESFKENWVRVQGR